MVAYRFRDVYALVIAMLGIDLRDTLAGQQMWELAHQEGRQEGAIEEVYEMVLEVLSEKFGVISGDIIDRIKAITHRETLKTLLKQIRRCDDLEQFKEILAEVKD